MKVLFHFLLFTLSFQGLEAQQQYADSLKKTLAVSIEDSNRVFLFCQLSDYYSYLYPDSAAYFADKAIDLSVRLKYPYGEALGALCKGGAYDRVADFPSALQQAYAALDLAKKLKAHRLLMMGNAYDFIAHLNHMTGNDKGSVELLHTAIELMNQSGENRENVYFAYFKIAFSLFNANQPDSALYYINKGKEFLPFLKNTLRQPTPWLITGNIYYYTGNPDSAEKYIREGIKISSQKNSLFLTAVLYNTLGSLFCERNRLDSCIFYKRRCLLLSRKYNYKIFEMEASGSLAEIYDHINPDSALKYTKIMLNVKEESINDSRLRQFQQVGYDNLKKQQDLEQEKKRFREQLKMYALLTIVAVFSVLAYIFWRNNRQKQAANILLNEQKDRAENALAELKITQAQLVQSEKMASLGELTAGIAHEIQNPLNFVNNFSDVNTELLDELKSEISKVITDRNQVLEDQLINDVIENEKKINLHGKKADSIVKGMLQHSRTGTGQKELTDINVLADECLRLSYHGFRSKEKSINLILHTDFEPGLDKISVVPQDLGRVFLNLFNNAFYSVAEKKKSAVSAAADLADKSSIGDAYEATVSVTTRSVGDPSGSNFLEIRIRDNGKGIPSAVVAKIFQPFFTTKPTGLGTGLGLSLSYDIITKGHNGGLKVNTQEGEFAEFIITLPVPRPPVPEGNIHLS